MSIDWRTADRIRIVQGKRRAIAVLDAQIAETEQDLATALTFEGEFSERLADVGRRISQVKPGYSPYLGQVKAAGGTGADLVRLESERSVIERERDDELVAKTEASTDGAGFRITYCRLRVTDVKQRLTALGAVRGRIAQELADLEGQLTPGQMVQSGVPAPDYTEHRERVERLRAQVSAGGPA